MATILRIKPDLQPVGEASNGREAVEFCTSTLPDVIMMDLMMPDVGGAAATAAIRKQWPRCK